jgi:hypothetical protein
MDFEQVEREMSGAKRERLPQIARPRLKRLPRQPRDEIEADVMKTGLA